MGRGIAKELQDASTALSNPGLAQQSWTRSAILDCAQQSWTHAAILDSLSNPGLTQQSWTALSNPELAQQSWTRSAILESPGDRRGRFFFFIDFFDKITM